MPRNQFAFWRTGVDREWILGLQLSKQFVDFSPLLLVKSKENVIDVEKDYCLFSGHHAVRSLTLLESQSSERPCELLMPEQRRPFEDIMGLDKAENFVCLFQAPVDHVFGKTKGIFFSIDLGYSCAVDWRMGFDAA